MKVLITTCDKYRFLIPGFVERFNLYWGYDAVLAGFDPPPCDLPDNFTWVSMGKQSKWGKTWTDPLKNIIDDVVGERFIFMLDDYYLSGVVSWSVIESLNKRPFSDAEKIDLSGDRVKFPHRIKTIDDSKIMVGEQREYGCLIESGQDARYRTSLQCAIWSRDYFKRFLNPGWQIWDFEILGEKLAMNDGATILGTEKPIVKYENKVVKGVPR